MSIEQSLGQWVEMLTGDVVLLMGLVRWLISVVECEVLGMGVIVWEGKEKRVEMGGDANLCAWRARLTRLWST